MLPLHSRGKKLAWAWHRITFRDKLWNISEAIEDPFHGLCCENITFDTFMGIRSIHTAVTYATMEPYDTIMFPIILPISWNLKSPRLRIRNAWNVSRNVLAWSRNEKKPSRKKRVRRKNARKNYGKSKSEMNLTK